ncbi:MAG: hypothetical protein BRD49_05510 [Bacteroidetes bacterium SW_10_40_5]|nr:MAG: hypothetical protein BRD49_05510 [Bacteroidetes bacterium SW_10_40_5]
MMRVFVFIGCFLSIFSASIAQQDTSGQSQTYTDIILDYQNPVKYRLSGISVKGNGPIKPNIVKAYSGLEVGEKVSIPGEKISNAIKNLWKQELFADVSIKVDDVNNRNLYLLIEVQTRPRLSKFKIRGASKNDASDIRDKIKLKERLKIITRKTGF